MTSAYLIPAASWRSFFDRVSGEAAVQRIEIEAASLDPGGQVAAEWLRLLGITYDAGDDLIDVAAAGFTHLIRQPREVYVQEGAAGIETIAVVTASGAKQVLWLREPLLLPGAPAGPGPAMPT